MSGTWSPSSSGDLRPGTTSSADLLHATFPPGSVTGAPKISAQSGHRRVGTAAAGRLHRGARLPHPGGRCGAQRDHPYLRDDRKRRSNSVSAAGSPSTACRCGSGTSASHKADPGAGRRCRSGGPTPRPAAADPGRAPRRRTHRDAARVETAPVLRLAAHLARLDRSCRELYGWSRPEDLAARVQQAASDARAIGPAPGSGGAGRRRDCGSPWRAGALPPRPDACDWCGGTRPAWCWRHKWAERTALAGRPTCSGRAGRRTTGLAVLHDARRGPGRDVPREPLLSSGRTTCGAHRPRTSTCCPG